MYELSAFCLHDYCIILLVSLWFANNCDIRNSPTLGSTRRPHLTANEILGYMLCSIMKWKFLDMHTCQIDPSDSIFPLPILHDDKNFITHNLSSSWQQNLYTIQHANKECIAVLRAKLARWGTRKLGSRKILVIRQNSRDTAHVEYLKLHFDPWHVVWYKGFLVRPNNLKGGV